MFASIWLLVAFLLGWQQRTQKEIPKPVAVTVPGKNVDSPAIWIAPKLEDSLVLLTEKGAGQVMVFKADAQATFVRRFGQLKRPNGVAVLQHVAIGAVKKDLAFVTDRDGDVIHVYSIPDFALVGTFGEGVKQPMGISLRHDKQNNAIFAYIVRKRGDGDDKVIRFRIGETGGRITGTREINFGSELSVGQETVVADEERGLLYVADENRRDIKVYDFDGKLQTTFGQGNFEAQVEGIALTGCGARGLIIASDQRGTTELEVFDRATFKHLATIKTSLKITDGIALTEQSLPDYPHGLFVAQSDPNGTGGRFAELYRLDELLASVGLQLDDKACRSR